MKEIDKSLSHSNTSNTSRNQYNKKTLLGKKARLQTKGKVRALDDKEEPMLSGYSFMPSGHTVLCDYESLSHSNKSKNQCNKKTHLDKKHRT